MRKQLNKVEKYKDRDNIITNLPQWFETEKAKRYQEMTWLDCRSNKRSVNCPEHHFQSLYLTASKKYVICNWDECGGRTTYEIITEEDANRWLSMNGYDAEGDFEI